MPPRTPLSVSPWSNSVHYSRMARPTTPIEIPHRHRPSANMSSSCYNSAYPEIFDMSPASPSMMETAHAHRQSHGQDQFLYHFPTYSSQRKNANPSPRSRSRLQPQQNVGRSSASPPIVAHAHTAVRAQPSPLPKTEKRATSPSQGPASGSKSRQPAPVTIVGFAPLKLSPGSSTQHTQNRSAAGRVRLSPPPMSFSYSSNPWILPGRDDTIEAESDEIDGDGEGGDYEFDKHLMNRINERLPLQRYGKPTFAGANHD